MDTTSTDEINYDTLWWLAPIAWALLAPLIYGLIAFPLMFFVIPFVYLYGVLPSIAAGLIFAVVFLAISKLSSHLRQDLSLAGLVAAPIGAFAGYISFLLLGAKASGPIACIIVSALLGTILIYWYGIKSRASPKLEEQSPRHEHVVHTDDA